MIKKRSTQMSFKEFENNLGDSQAVLGTQRTLNGAEIENFNLTPEDLIKLIDRDVVIVLRSSWRAEIPRLLALAVSALFAIYFTMEDPSSFVGIMPMHSFLPLAILAIIIRKRFNRKYVIAESQVSTITGLISWKYSRIRLEYDQLKAVEIEKTLLGRILNVGNIRMSTFLFDEPEMLFLRLYNPEFFATVIRIKHQIAKEGASEATVDTFKDAAIVEENG